MSVSGVVSRTDRTCNFDVIYHSPHPSMTGNILSQACLHLDPHATASLQSNLRYTKNYGEDAETCLRT